MGTFSCQLPAFSSQFLLVEDGYEMIVRQRWVIICKSPAGKQGRLRWRKPGSSQWTGGLAARNPGMTMNASGNRFDAARARCIDFEREFSKLTGDEQAILPLAFREQQPHPGPAQIARFSECASATEAPRQPPNSPFSTALIYSKNSENHYTQTVRDHVAENVADELVTKRKARNQGQAGIYFLTIAS